MGRVRPLAPHEEQSVRPWVEARDHLRGELERVEQVLQSLALAIGGEGADLNPRDMTIETEGSDDAG